MPKIIDLTPSFRIKTAEQELYTPYVAGELPLGQNIGGLQMFTNGFQGGAGNSVFKSDGQGMWLGAADFASAPFKVNMAGAMTATSGTFTGTIQSGSVISANISADRITTGTLNGTNVAVTNLSASNITTGTLNGRPITNSTISGTSTWNGNAIDAAYIGNLDAGKITTGTLNAARIGASSITADKVNIGTLDAISGSLGTIIAGSISGVTITGSTFRTAASGTRVLIDTSNTIKFYYGSTLYGEFYNDGSTGNFIVSSPQTPLYLSTDGSDYINVSGAGGIGGIPILSFNTHANDTNNGSLWFYDAGGSNYYFRSRNGTWNGQFDQTGF